MVVGSINVIRRIDVSIPTSRKETTRATYSLGLSRETKGILAMVQSVVEVDEYWSRGLTPAP